LKGKPFTQVLVTQVLVGAERRGESFGSLPEPSE
jgi:hypothetical protein